MTKNTLKQLIRECIKESDEASTNKYDALHAAEDQDARLLGQLMNDKLDDLYKELHNSVVLRGSDQSGKYRHKVNVRKVKGDVVVGDYELNGGGIQLAAIKNFLGLSYKTTPLLFIQVDPKDRTYILWDNSNTFLHAGVARAETVSGIKSLEEILKLIKDRLREMLKFVNE